jgi:DNA-binding MarR family transcriptional regulator
MKSAAGVKKRASVSSGTAELPLSTLLSQVLVAFTIEFDNEFERQMPHLTSNYGSTPGSPNAPWLVSLVTWSNCMRFVGEKGLRVAELEVLARTKTNLNGMARWGYIVVEPDPADSRPKPPISDWMIRATPAGRKAQEIWRPLFAAIEKRWEERFGADDVESLRESAGALNSQVESDLPDCLPILGYGLFSKGPEREGSVSAGRESADGFHLTLAALLSRVLLAFAIEFERESDLSLAICANAVRVLSEEGVRVRDLPQLTGVSKEAINVALGILRKSRAAVIEPDKTGGRAKIALLTPKGREAQDAYRQLLGVIEERWQARFGKNVIRNLRQALERLVDETTAQDSPVFRGLEPHPGGWRASVRKPDTLPHFPVVLHRGGFPDGS